MEKDSIIIKGAREHNLKNIDLEIPRDSFTVITGLSGSGKSSLAFDTIYAEGQRRYIESLSAYARQFLDMLEKPEVDLIEGLSPAISIEQKSTSGNPRSTVGTVTEIYDYLRLLYARIGKPHCYNCGKPVKKQSASQIIDSILNEFKGKKVSILSPVVKGRKGHYRELFEEILSDGFLKVRVDGEVKEIIKGLQVGRYKIHNIEIVVDRLIVKKTSRSRITESVEVALNYGDGIVIVNDGNDDNVFSRHLACLDCGISYRELAPNSFSFNSPYGSCSDCQGLGEKKELDPNLIIPDWDKSINEEGLAPLGKPRSIWFFTQLDAVAEKYNFDFKTPLNKLHKEHINVILTGLSIQRASEFFRNLKLTGRDALIAKPILKEINERLHFLLNVGLDYLTLNRSARTLSGGESQRIRLATQIGTQLAGVLYVLDEPSIGLHQNDNIKLINSLKNLRDLGNTIIVVEHDRETIESSDYMVDLGPGAGEHGGEVVLDGITKNLINSDNGFDSLTLSYLKRREKIRVPTIRRKGNGKSIELIGASGNNLQNINMRIPLGTLTLLTGVSGSGKSSVLNETLVKILMNRIYKSKSVPLKYKAIEGLENIDKIIEIDQSAIGRTPRSNPATYTGLFTFIRDLFAQLPESKMRGYKTGRFSFNVSGGRCEECNGDGLRKIEMNFLPDVHVHCDSCKGRRYNRETLEVLYKTKSIADVLEMRVDKALEFFEDLPRIKRKLQAIHDVGLGYIKLGQQATTLSGGEAQRVKLATELSKVSTGKTFYVLDEPTTGLHFEDVRILLDVLNKLVDKGNTVVIVEHNMDVIKMADWIIDLGPGGGEYGGSIVAEGVPEEIIENKKSLTGKFLAEELA